jgi:AcrR family transcriptional regulator
MKLTKDFDKKQAIFESMLDLISKHGFHSSPMSEVAKQANVATGTIYHYFKSKDELICALYVKIKAEGTLVLLKNDDSNKAFRDRFRLFYQQSFNYFTKNTKEFYFLEQFSCSPFIHQLSKTELQALEQPIYDFLRRGVFTQVLRDISPKIMTSFVVGSSSALIKLQLSGEFIVTPSDLESAFITCWDGIKKQ